MSEQGKYDPNQAGTRPWYSPEQFPVNSIDAMPHQMMVMIADITQAVRESGASAPHDVADAVAQLVGQEYGSGWCSAARELSLKLYGPEDVK